MTQQQKNKPHRIRPTLIVGLGGTGHRVALRLKQLIWQSWGSDLIGRQVKFLVFDTAREDLSVSYNGHAVTIEPGHEFYDIGQTPVANIKRNLERQAAIEERLGSVMSHLPPAVLRNGAKQLRPLGLLALLWRYPEIEAALKDAIWALAGRRHNEQREGINVVIVNSLGGGTGSSAFLDIAHLIRDLFDELGMLADFCYITGVGVLPRAFHGINGPNLIPNAVASLKELNHCMMRGGFTARYPNNRTITTAQPPFNMYYLVDGIDERGHTWSSLADVCRLVAEAIFLQMGSQVGQKHENDFDNLDDVLVRQTAEGDGTFYGSFGLASLLFPAEAVAQACAARLALRLVVDTLLTTDSATPPESARRADELIELAELTPAVLAERLASDEEGLSLAVELNMPGWAKRLPAAALPAEMVRYVRDYEQARLGTDFKRALNQNETALAGQAGQRYAAYLTRLTRQQGAPAAEAFLAQLLARLNQSVAQFSGRQTDRDSQQLALAQELGHLETALLQAAESNFLMRKHRVMQAHNAYLTTAQKLFATRWEGQVSAAIIAIFNQVSRQVQADLAACRAVTTRLEAVQRALRPLAAGHNDTLEPTGVTTQSLATESVVDQLFQQYAPAPSDILATLFSGGASPLDWQDTAPADIQQQLLVACQPAFAGVAALTVEQVIAWQAAETPPQSHHTWLLAQATPSWNLDRTRLPEGGSALQRLEVLGVPDEAESLYREQSRSLVSTGDARRITAFAAHVGAAHTAIQQWDSYQQAYDQARGHVPLHILPHFQTNGEKARQTFALGWMFGFIKNQGAYFYYIPSDSLSPQMKLGQGLANSLETFLRQDALVLEVRERVEQIVATQGVEATLRRLTRYYDTDNGRPVSDDLILELKRLVRAYADELRQIHQFAPGNWAGDDDLPALVSRPAA